MAQKIVTTCDVHAARDEDAPGRPWTVTIQGPGDRQTAYVVDLCDDDSKALVELRDMVAELGRQLPSSAAARRPPGLRQHDTPTPGVEIRGITADSQGRWPCPACGKSSKTWAALRDHVRRNHHTTVASLIEGEDVRTWACPECGDEFTTPQGRGAHRKKTHGVAGSSESARRGRGESVTDG